MKTVPSIKLLVINIQMKLIMGFFIIMAIAWPMSGFLQDLMDYMFEILFDRLRYMAIE
jgi:flagellar biosynthesis protein FliR